MADNEIPPKAAPEVLPKSEQPTPQPEMPAEVKAEAPAYDEFGSAKRNLPPLVPIGIAIVLVGVVVGILVYVNRARPIVQGSIDGVWFSQPVGMPSPMILIEVTLRNVSDKPLYIKDLKADVKTEQGDESDEAASASDYERYLSAYPDLRGHANPLKVEMKILPGAEQKGTVMISPPVTQQQFDTRKDLTVTIEPYDQKDIVLRENTGAAK